MSDVWIQCNRAEAEQYRTRSTNPGMSVIHASPIDFEPWSEWVDGRGDVLFGNVQYQYRRRKQLSETDKLRAEVGRLSRERC